VPPDEKFINPSADEWLIFVPSLLETEWVAPSLPEDRDETSGEQEERATGTSMGADIFDLQITQ
jgi:hypothetical protein